MPFLILWNVLGCFWPVGPILLWASSRHIIKVGLGLLLFLKKNECLSEFSEFRVQRVSLVNFFYFLLAGPVFVL